MKRGILSLYAVVMILSFSLIPAVPAGAASKPLPTTIYADVTFVGGGQDGSLTKPFDTIQAAVDHAIDGNIIRVAAGTYNEAVRITTNDLTLKGEAGAIVDGTGVAVGTSIGGFGVLGASGVTIEGFDIRNHSGGHTGGGAGILLHFASNNHVKWNTISNSSVGGIILWFASDNIVADNEISQPAGGAGIILIHQSHKNEIKRNEMSGSRGAGISLVGQRKSNGFPSDNLVAENTISVDGGHGISLNAIFAARTAGNVLRRNNISGVFTDGIALFSSNNIAERNVISGGAKGIHISGSDNVVKWNEIDGGGGEGIRVAGNNHLVKYNEITDRGRGIFAFQARSNEIIWNDVSDSSGDGISVRSSGAISANDNLVKWNTVSGSGGNGIAVLSGASRNLIKENTVSGSGTVDLFHDGASTPNTWTSNSCGTKSGAEIPGC